MRMRLPFVTAAAIYAAFPAQPAQAQIVPPLCQTNVPFERWNNCFGQLRAGGDMLYSGYFVRGVYEGFGTLITPDGTYSGEFRNGKFEGQGIFLLPDGSRYAGGWRAGLMNGNGRFVGADGREFVGTFANGQLVQAANQGAVPPQAAPAPARPVVQPAPPRQAVPQPAAQPARPVAQAAPPRQAVPQPVAQPARPVAQAASPRQAAVGSAFIPSRTWDCSTGYYPNVSYSSLVTSGNSYTTSWRDGSGARKGTYSRGSSSTAYGGISIGWASGTWSSFKGEYIPAGTIDPRTGKAAKEDSVNVGVDSSYWSTSCYAK